MFGLELPERFRRYVPLAVLLVVVVTVLFIPLKIVGYGYLPSDDALRHAAKAVSGKPWPEILVVGDSFKIDHNLGWHTILGALHHAFGWSAEQLVVVSVLGLFLAANLSVLPWLRRPEVWLAALLISMLVADYPLRLMLGRPFLLTSTVLMMILFIAQKSNPCLKNFLLVTALITACTYVHGVWYLWVLPIGAFFFAGQFRWMALLLGAWLGGVGLAALLTGHPWDYLSQAISMATRSVGLHVINRTEAGELQPFNGELESVVLVGALVLLRRMRQVETPLIFNPAFWLVCGCWMLGFRVGRFWADWGWPAMMVLVATELDFLVTAKIAADSLRRLLLALILAAAAFLCLTSDLGSRWTRNLLWQYLSEAEHPELKGWMPEPGGIFYTADMSIFYQTFFKNPNGDWRYIVGYEPALMPAEDFAIYEKVHWNFGDAKTYEPWVKKMKPADRLVIRGDGGSRPNIPELEWYYGVSGIWIGRTPR